MKRLDHNEMVRCLPALIEAAEKGEPTVITRDGRPVAALVPIDHAERLYPESRPSFATLLAAIPDQLDIERDTSPLRDVDF